MEKLFHRAEHGIFEIMIGGLFIIWIRVEIPSKNNKICIGIIDPTDKLLNNKKQFVYEIYSESNYKPELDVLCSKHCYSQVQLRRCESQIHQQQMKDEEIFELFLLLF